MYSIAEIEITEEMTFMEFSEEIETKMKNVDQHTAAMSIVLETKPIISGSTPNNNVLRDGRTDIKGMLYHLFGYLWSQIKEKSVSGCVIVLFSPVINIYDYKIVANVYVPTKVNHS